MKSLITTLTIISLTISTAFAADGDEPAGCKGRGGQQETAKK